MKKILLGVFTLLLPFLSIADTLIDLKAGSGIWRYDPAGSIASSADGAGTSADLNDDFGFAENNDGYIFYSVEHPVPYLPNVKVMHTGISSVGAGNVSTDFTFNNTSFSADTAISTRLQLNQTDYVMYYQFLNNTFNFDLGLNLKYIDGKAVVNANNLTQTNNFSGYLPIIIYAAAEIKLPANMSAAVEANISGIGQSYINDIVAKITYTTKYKVGIEAGVRSQIIQLSKFDGINSDIEYVGIFTGVYYNF